MKNKAINNNYWKNPEPFPLVSTQMKYETPTITFCDFECGAYCPPMPKEEKKPMANEKTETQIQRDYLSERLREVRQSVRSKLTDMFHIYDNTKPKSYKDLIDWIKNGKYTLDTKMTNRIDNAITDDGQWYGSFLDGIIWTGAGFTNDFDGFEKATKELDKQTTLIRDKIMLSPGDALAAILALETWTPSNAPTATTSA